eukprot:gnl/TRDRNA2_/TRDRNA2_88364_c1_seq1.p1 gnl/TRDRNA2_/TRDRNA2_88364_c1~~gnl/TRDRNA2_/TRDRNA2_88364_c1_seq1.p1  ORF type:complete len:152 (+),score=38.65 gnl/TRDRNA2_/TRDRNA2_88364_c1_seq1:161-616(+)
MLDRVEKRQEEAAMPVHDLAQPLEEINSVPSVCLFIEGLPKELQRAFFAGFYEVAKSFAQENSSSKPGDPPKLLFFMAVGDAGASPQVRAICGLNSSPALAVLDIQKGCCTVFDVEACLELPLKEFPNAMNAFVQDYLKGSLPSKPLVGTS